MATYILVHGAWQGGWCWRKVVPLLERQGHTVLAPDCPVSADSLEPWTEVVVRLIDTQAEPVILAGHSMGGAVISAAAERRPHKIRALAYVCAYLLGDGESLRDAARRDRASQAPSIIVRSPDRTSMTFRQDAAAEVFYTGCSPEDVAWALSQVRPQATGSWATPIHITEERFGRVPRFYIECLRDQAISLDFQREMQAAIPCRQVFSLDTGHSPFLSAPEQLAEILSLIADQ